MSTRFKVLVVLNLVAMLYMLSVLYTMADGLVPVRYRIRESCLQAEDTAAHLRLVDYGGTVVRYGCYRKGY